MLSFKIERAIFILIFIMCFIVCVYFATQIKMNELPINKGLTPEQVIESKYKGQEYKYKIYDNIMFVCVENKQGYSGLDYAFRNDYSGFMFEIPGFFIGSVVQQKAEYISILDEEPFVLRILEFKSKYYVTITDSYNKIKNIDFYKNGRKLDYLTIENAQSQYWVCELEDLSSFNEIEGFYNGVKIQIVEV